MTKAVSSSWMPFQYGLAVEEHVLRPVAVGLLRDAEVEQDAPRVLVLPDGEQAADRLDHVARPDEVIAQVAVAVANAPRDGQAGDDARRGNPWLRGCA